MGIGEVEVSSRGEAPLYKRDKLTSTGYHGKGRKEEETFSQESCETTISSEI